VCRSPIPISQNTAHETAAIDSGASNRVHDTSPELPFPPRRRGETCCACSCPLRLGLGVVSGGNAPVIHLASSDSSLAISVVTTKDGMRAMGILTSACGSSR
jgi:hypothetical protein